MKSSTKSNRKTKFKRIKTKRCILTSVLAGCIILLNMIGCTNLNNSFNNTLNKNSSIENSSNNENESNQGDSQEIDYSQYSQTFQNVLNKRSYAELMSLNDSYQETTNSPLYKKNAKYNAIPYGFLEDEGMDIKEIKNNQVDSSSMLYTINNDLYIEVSVEIKATINYFTQYIIKYDLTDQELKELNEIFVMVKHRDTTYYQAPFFIQELSYLKKPTIISKVNITKDALKTFEDYVDDKEYISSWTSVIFMNYYTSNINDQILYHTYQIHPKVTSRNAYPVTGRMQIAKITFKTYGGIMEIINDQNVNALTNTLAIFLTEAKKVEFQESVREVSFYNCENAEFVNIYDNKEALNNILRK